MDDTVLKTTAMAGDGPERETESAERALGEGEAAGAGTGAGHQVFAMQFTSSPRGARLARRLAVRRLEEWGHPPASDTLCTVALLVGELTANAVRHGRVPGREFRLRLALDAQARLVRIEVSDAGPEWPRTGSVAPASDDESGRGLLLVDTLAARWGTMPRAGVGKTVWAEVSADPTTQAM
ncbi:ATP-binding protein [Streptomyces sp. 8N706]|uniref:ATP-binding protein n=1 Tax=Streptomyces sp. 8N706 TaxID=3457416 RepID=UPI003FD62D1E